MYITGLIQRDRLLEICTRWFADRLEPGDGTFVTQVFVFESLVFAPSVMSFVRDVGRELNTGPYCLERLRSKNQVRDLIVKSCPDPSPRARELFKRYRRNPEEFFPRTPVDLIAATTKKGDILGMMRVKQIRRIAEKASRRVADRLASEITQTATLLAHGRASLSGVSLDELASSAETMAEEFFEAERAVSLAFREGEITFERQELRIDDVVAVKFVGTPAQLERIEKAIADHPLARLHEREVHSGRYNAINLLVDITLPDPAEIIDRTRGFDWSFAASRGLDPATLPGEFAAYVESGARTFRLEIILTTLEELVESEFGRSTHEERILEQRHQAAYSGRIARNATHIINYLILLALSPKVEVSEIPIKMWGRYLTDTISLSVDELFGIEQGPSLYTLFAKHPLELPGIVI